MKKSLQSGFTLAETIVTIFVFSIIMLGTSLMLKDILVNARQQSIVLNNTDQARVISNNFVKEIRNATYGINGAYPVNQATDSQIIFFSTAPKGNGTISRVRYYISNNILYKGITNPSGSPLDYNLGTETVTPILTKMSLGASPLFYYYDGNYAGTGSALTTPINLNQVKFIKMNLIVLKQLAVNNNTTFSVSAGASIRNLKTNLGN